MNLLVNITCNNLTQSNNFIPNLMWVHICCIFRPAYFVQKSFKKSKKFAAKFCPKHVFLSLHQNAGQLFYSQKMSFFSFRPAFGVRSTQPLVEIYNNHQLSKGLCFRHRANINVKYLLLSLIFIIGGCFSLTFYCFKTVELT